VKALPKTKAGKRKTGLRHHTLASRLRGRPDRRRTAQPVLVKRLFQLVEFVAHEAYIKSPDRALPDPISVTDLKKAWGEVNHKLTSAFEAFTPKEWLEKHTAVSDEDFAKDPTRNRLALVMNRTNHASFHRGQAILAK
jgi:hypothetical protein